MHPLLLYMAMAGNACAVRVVSALDCRRQRVATQYQAWAFWVYTKSPCEQHQLGLQTCVWQGLYMSYLDDSLEKILTRTQNACQQDASQLLPAGSKCRPHTPHVHLPFTGHILVIEKLKTLSLPLCPLPHQLKPHIFYSSMMSPTALPFQVIILKLELVNDSVEVQRV